MRDLKECITWEMGFLINCDVEFLKKFSIKEFNFEYFAGKNIARINIQAKDIAEAENIAKEKMMKIIPMINIVLGYKITAELRHIRTKGHIIGISQSIHVKGPKKKELVSNEKISDIENLYNLSLKDENVSKVIELLNIEKPKTWGNLYKIYEIINHDTKIDSKSWATKKIIDDFKHTANSPEALGINEARHGHSNQQPPKEPMENDEAIKLIENIINNWIKYKKEKLGL